MEPYTVQGLAKAEGKLRSELIDKIIRKSIEVNSEPQLSDTI